MNSKIILLFLILISLASSVIFSVSSFTGYIVSDIPNEAANLKAFAFLAAGIVGSLIYIKFQKNKAPSKANRA